MYALADCNNFFVSCERAFQPELEGRAVVVLSNNDGCIVARSNESKAMGIKMGTPFFKVKDLAANGSLIVRSSNYKLYGDLSSRVMSILADAVPRIEVYSIDEAFLDMKGISDDKVPQICRELIVRIRQWTGIPISIGIAPTKTLAKVANHFAKKYPGYKGVCIIDSDEKRQKALSLTPIDDVWGIGRRMGPKLMSWGMLTAADLAAAPEKWIDNCMGLSGLRTWQELNGKCAVTNDERERRQTICTSRSFAQMCSDEAELRLRVGDFAGKCAEKLREENSAARCVTTFLYTNRFRSDMSQYMPAASIRLEVAASSTQEIVSAALKALKLIYRPEYQYKKAGVTVSEIIGDNEIEAPIFDFDETVRDKADRLSKIMDKVNKDSGNKLHLATQRSGHYSQDIRTEHCSPRFSTDWNDIIKIK